MSMKKSLSIIDTSFIFFGVDNIAIFFNVGKDNSVVFSLIYYYIKKNLKKRMPLFVYFKTKYHIPQVEEYIDFMVSRYDLKFICYKCNNLKNGLKLFKSHYPHINCIFMGNRKTDPYSDKLKYFSSTTEGWPYYIRVNPILDWSYKQVWKYIIVLELRVCELYNHGYTSLGSLLDTSKNPYLSYINKYGDRVYAPAWCLKDETKERAGRKKIQLKIFDFEKKI